MDVQDIIQVLVFFFLFVLPGIMSARKSKERRAKPPAQSRPAPPAAEAGRRAGADADGGDLWKKLLRGEIDPAAPTPSAKPAPKPKPAPTPPAVRRKRPPRPAREPLTRSAQDDVPLTRQPSSEGDRPLTREPSTEGHRPLTRQPSTEEARPLTRQASSEATPGAPLRDVGAGLAPSLGARADHIADELVEREVRSSFSGGLTELADASGPVARVALPREIDWRRAIVLSEVLGPPIGLRDPQAGFGAPPALRP